MTYLTLQECYELVRNKYKDDVEGSKHTPMPYQAGWVEGNHPFEQLLYEVECPKCGKINRCDVRLCILEDREDMCWPDCFEPIVFTKDLPVTDYKGNILISTNDNLNTP